MNFCHETKIVNIGHLINSVMRQTFIKIAYVSDNFALRVVISRTKIIKSGNVSLIARQTCAARPAKKCFTVFTVWQLTFHRNGEPTWTSPYVFTRENTDARRMSKKPTVDVIREQFAAVEDFANAQPRPLFRRTLQAFKMRFAKW